MKKILSLLLAVMLAFSICACENEVMSENETQTNISDSAEKGAQNPMNGVFRYANWGDSLNEVEKREPKICDVKTEEYLAYDDVKLLSYNTSVVYSFGQNGFNGGIYTITDKHTNNNLYIEDFDSINEELTKKYGEPTLNDNTWTDDMYKDDIGFALFMGQVSFDTWYESNNVVVMHNLHADNLEITHTISYINPNDTEPSAVDASGL